MRSRFEELELEAIVAFVGVKSLGLIHKIESVDFAYNWEGRYGGEARWLQYRLNTQKLFGQSED